LFCSTSSPSEFNDSLSMRLLKSLDVAVSGLY
jgi:hypothetical protein